MQNSDNLTHSPHLDTVPTTSLTLGPRSARAVASLIARGLVRSAHDCSDGGLLVAIAEMLIGGDLGAEVDLAGVHADPVVAAFSETPSRYVLEVAEGDVARVRAGLGEPPSVVIGKVTASKRLTWRGGGVDESVEALAQAWLAPLDW